MIYTCEDCGFLFSRVGEVDECPSCEGKHIRPATDKEAEWLNKTLDNSSICNTKHNG